MLGGEFVPQLTGKYTYWIVMDEFDGSREAKPSNLVVLNF